MKPMKIIKIDLKLTWKNELTNLKKKLTNLKKK